ncbi:DHA2 family efflux MFS transporter permease subunit [Pseudactinotalea sp. HY160]|nr:DHA2 family efflux MFS transporter permease subunit [Pseudactinotalea sp. HY160]MPV49868.1 DHA2 family efflux MFS transporter permease subunit [Pseudactinotalea sp. HY160]QGH70961.1 DHA2 family efflux MFS transporter permease subunit [Pseudactinotalea sp. HY158]
MVVAAFVMILNETIVSIALPDLAVVMSVTTTTVQWLISGFLLTMAVVIPTTGYLLQRFSPRRIFLMAIGSFAAGTLLCAVAPTFPALLIGRMVQACGTAVMIPLVMTTVMRLVPPSRRGATMGTISIVIGVAPAIGPTVGGAILAAFGWRWMFWLVLILALAMFTVGIARLHVPNETRRVPLDLVSVALSAIGFAGIVYGLASIGQGGGVLPPWASLVIGVAGIALFVWRQGRLQRQDRPLLDLRTLTRPRFRLALILSLFLFMALIGAGAILLPIYLQNVLDHGTLVAGLALLPGGLAMAAVARPVGALYDRVGARPLVIPGAIGMTVALWILALLGGGAPLGAVIAAHVLLMLSLGLMMTPLMTDSLSALPSDLYSHGSALLATLQQVAGALGSAVFVTVAALGSASPGGIPDATGIRAGFMVAGGIGLVAVVVACLFKRPDPAEAADVTDALADSGG